MGRELREAWNTWAVPWKLPWTVAGRFNSRGGLLDQIGRLAQGSAGVQIEGNGDGGKLALMVDGEVGVGVLNAGDGGQRHQFSGGGFDEDFLQGIGALQVGRI